MYRRSHLSTDRHSGAGEGRQALLGLRSVAKSYGSRTVLRSVDFSIEAGESVALVGTNGSGKTTVVNLIAGLSRADRGRITVAGHSPGSPQAVAAVSSYREVPPELDGIRVDRIAALLGAPSGPSFPALLERFGLSGSTRFSALSPGERAAAMLSAAVARPSRLLLLDEPTRGLDPYARTAVDDVLDEERAQGRGILLTTHLTSIGASVERVLVLDQGHIVFDGPSRSLSPDRAGAVTVPFRHLVAVGTEGGA